MQNILSIGLDESKNGHRSRKHICPSCGKKTFVRYFNFHIGEYLPGEYGRCDREESCGYFMPPPHKQHHKHPSRLEYSLLNQTMKAYKGNSFFCFLEQVCGLQEAQRLSEAYRLGTTRKNEVIFWQIDIRQEVRSGKIMKYGTDGHRTGSTDWVHSRLEREGKLPGFDLEQCFFGEHLLKASSIDTPVAIVESEKTAVIASGLLKDTPFVWLAAGSKYGMGGKALNRLKCSPLAGRTVILFPDLTSPDSKADETCYQHWSRIASQLRQMLRVEASVSDYLESTATNEMSSQQWDLADYLLWANEYSP